MTTHTVDLVVDDALVERGARALYASIARETFATSKLRLEPFASLSAVSQARWRRWARCVLEGAHSPEPDVDGSAAS